MMASTRSTLSNSQQPAMFPQSSTNNIFPPRPTYTNVVDMLNAADVDVGVSYAHIPQLQAELRTHFRDGIEECKLGERDPADLLLTRLRQERRVFDAYNKHRLNQAAFRHYRNITTPEDAEERLATLGEDIAEDLESFPLRCEVVMCGFDALTEDLLPIYQSEEHAAQLAKQVPVTPQTRKKSEGKAPAKGASPSTPTKTGRAVENYDKLQYAPAPNLDFPLGNMTLAEIAAFLPNALKSWDLIDRFCSNGGSQAIFAKMINQLRKMDRGKIENNSVYRMMKGTTQKLAKADPEAKPEWKYWTTGVHSKYHNSTNFDPASVSITGFRTPADGKKATSAPPIPIKDLANGVKTFPTGYDALDLTRAVRYCQAHPDENWIYPDDYERLVSQLPQDAPFAGHPAGPTPVHFGHQDAQVMSRYTTTRLAAGLRNASGRKRDSHGRLLKVEVHPDEEEDFDKKGTKRKRNGFFDDSHDDDVDDTPSRKPDAKRTKIAPKPRASRNPAKRTAAPPSRLRKEIFADDIDSESDGDGYQGPKKAKKVQEVRRSTRKTKFTKSFNIDANDAIDEDEEDFPKPVLKKANLVSKYGMDADKSGEDDFLDEE